MAGLPRNQKGARFASIRSNDRRALYPDGKADAAINFATVKHLASARCGPRPTNIPSRSAKRHPAPGTRDDADAESRVTGAEWMHSSGSPDGHGAFGVNPMGLGRRLDMQAGIQCSGSMGSALSGAAAARASPSSSASGPDGMMT